MPRIMKTLDMTYTTGGLTPKQSTPVGPALSSVGGGANHHERLAEPTRSQNQKSDMVGGYYISYMVDTIS